MKKPAAARSRVVFWPFALFGNPGAEAGVTDLCHVFLDRLAEYEAAPDWRLHDVARTTRVDLREFNQVEDLVGWREEIRKHFDACLRRGERPFFIGGNHLFALPVYEAYSAARARTCVLCFDAHLDAYDLPGAKEKLNHGNFLLHLAKSPRLAIANVGHRDLTLARPDIDAFFDRTWPIEDMLARPIEAVAADIGRYLAPFERVHLDLDLDVLDPGTLRAVGSPMPFGLSAPHLLALLAAVPPEKLSGVTISEYNGAADPDGAGRHLVLWLLDWLLLRVAGPNRPRRRRA